MILYHTAIWMEQRSRLMEQMEEADGDVSFFMYRKQRLDEMMRERTGRWMKGSWQEEHFPALLLEAGGESFPIVLDEL
ncbi:hypothetical protein [Paenibacillus turpanensis]|uniref:hypothetical protein n=1 Tax=Paenibacillus turpanensis TaxID=2689078 RepID=UPI00140D7A27|nr:hypothetical protein [Paenibacillus turpanensis]